MGIIKKKSFFTSIEAGSKNLTFAILDAFAKDTDPNKVNLCIGVYCTEDSQPYILPAVKKTEAKMIACPQNNHEYIPSFGEPRFTKACVEFLLGNDSPAILEGRAHGIQTISGSGALYMGAQFLCQVLNFKRIYLSNPSWENHERIFARAGFEDIRSYRYWNPKSCSVDIDGMLYDLENAADGSVVLLHACAHNPTGCDPTSSQWISIADTIERKNLFVFFDSAYQGFASGDVNKDSFAVRHFVSRGFEMLCSQSFSKIFGLYGERVGNLELRFWHCNLAVVHKDPSTMQMVKEQLTTIAFDTYLSPPKHGALIVQAILSDADLFNEWQENLKVMPRRIKSIRQSLYNELIRLNTPGSWKHIIDQIGMFSYTGLNERQVKFLTDEYHIYLRKTGRISMCGLNNRNIPYVAKAIHAAVTTIPS